ncbi:MAG: outer membrane lipoprotein carrier protein LolA [Bacteroidetes bacterium]|nr:outer membrane lipoprotein carrier protein LolA [Bacteroidota bacterium]
MIKQVVYSITILFLTFSVHAQDDALTVKRISEQLQRRYEMIDDATIVFTQHVKFGFSKIEQSFEGTLIMKKPKCYRIESEHQTLVTDGTTVWAYSPANKQVIIDHYRENQNTISPEQFLLTLPSQYYTTVLGKEKVKDQTLVILKLIPKDDRSFIQSVKLWIDTSTWMIMKVLIADVNETETTYSVKSAKFNTNVKEKLFIFIPPSDTDVVDLR